MVASGGGGGGGGGGGSLGCAGHTGIGNMPPLSGSSPVLPISCGACNLTDGQPQNARGGHQGCWAGYVAGLISSGSLPHSLMCGRWLTPIGPFWGPSVESQLQA